MGQRFKQSHIAGQTGAVQSLPSSFPPPLSVFLSFLNFQLHVCVHRVAVICGSLTVYILRLNSRTISPGSLQIKTCWVWWLFLCSHPSLNIPLTSCLPRVLFSLPTNACKSHFIEFSVRNNFPYFDFLALNSM